MGVYGNAAICPAAEQTKIDGAEERVYGIRWMDTGLER